MLPACIFCFHLWFRQKRLGQILQIAERGSEGLAFVCRRQCVSAPGMDPPPPWEAVSVLGDPAMGQG